MVVKNVDEVKPLPVDGAVDVFIIPLITRFDGAQDMELRRFTIKPGGRIPAHLHPEIEHVQYVLKGSYLVGIGDKVYRVKEGDAILIPRNSVHWYENDGREEAVFICVIPRREYTTKTVEL